MKRSKCNISDILNTAFQPKNKNIGEADLPVPGPSTRESMGYTTSSRPSGTNVSPLAVMDTNDNVTNQNREKFDLEHVEDYLDFQIASLLI